MNQLVSLGFGDKVLSRFEKGNAVGDGETDEKIDDGGNRPVGEDLYKGVDLILFADRSDFEKSKTGVHGKDHDCAKHEKQDVGTVS